MSFSPALDLSDVEQQNIDEIRFSKSQNYAAFFSFDKDIYILLDNKVNLISPTNSSYQLSQTNFSLDKITDDDKIVFLKVNITKNIDRDKIT